MRLNSLEQDQLDLFPLTGGRSRPERDADAALPLRKFTFIDLFAGIGGFRIGLQKVGGECVFSSEWDRYSRQTYEAWFGEAPFGDIREVKPSEVPDHDILAGGFPCQPFSLAGVSKKNSLGRAHGFLCETQGTLFFEVAKIIAEKRPAAVFLENVKNLRSHDRGRTWQVIERTLTELGYWVFSGVIDAAGWVPQHRERVYIVCFDQSRFPERPDFWFPSPPKGESRFASILDPDTPAKYTLSAGLWQYLQDYAAKHRAKGNGFGFGIANPDGVARTLSARYHKDGSEILIGQGEGRAPRRLSPRECARLMGFDKWCEEKIVVSDTQAYRQFGNAVVPKVIEAVGREIISVL
ncbi:MAG: (cytosine-5)-methyltransferase 1 [Bryobacterales bacterium]|nr:(cytosine-5)-methyltransferase 1 [Bryobacterales bacterium]